MKAIEGTMSFGDPIIDFLQKASGWFGFEPDVSTTQAAQMVPGTAQAEGPEAPSYGEFQEAFREDPLGQTAQYMYPEHIPEIAAGEPLPEDAYSEAALRMMRATTPEALAGVAVREAGGSPAAGELAEVVSPGPADVRTAAVFGMPNLARLAKKAGKEGADLAAKYLARGAEREAPLRKAAANWLSRARTTVYKKGTPLGDTLRKVGWAPGAEPSVKLKGEDATHRRLIESAAAPGGQSINVPVKASDDPAAAMHIVAHEKSHVDYNRMKVLARHDPVTRQVKDLLEAAVIERKGWRRPGSVMQSSVISAREGLPFREAERYRTLAKGVDKPHPRGRAIDIPDEPILGEHMAERRMGEQIADLLAELTTVKGQQGLPVRVKEILSVIMDFK
jgi:hypothetical protein